MSGTTRWWWVRHAPVVNPDGTIYGHSDLCAELSDGVGIRSLAGCLPRDAVWLTTTLRRARETAETLAGHVSGETVIREDDRFREQAFGDWEGRRWDDIPEPESAAYWCDPAANRAPGGESFADVLARVGAAVDALNDDCAGRDIVVVAHAGSIRAGLVHALKCPPSAGLAFRVAPLSLTRMDAVSVEGAVWWRIGGVNLPMPFAGGGVSY